MGHTKRNCDYCKKEYMADNRNLKRGWGLCCSKSCAAKKREMNKSGHNPENVKTNNIKRRSWNAPGVYEGDGIVTGYTAEGYRIMSGIAYDEFDHPVYHIN